MEKYGTTIQITDDNITRHMRIACLIPTATKTHTQNIENVLILHDNKVNTHVHQYCVKHTLPCSFTSFSHSKVTSYI